MNLFIMMNFVQSIEGITGHAGCGSMNHAQLLKLISTVIVILSVIIWMHFGDILFPETEDQTRGKTFDF